jgi:alpha-tubulin suppressor-like RCC1 family protein
MLAEHLSQVVAGQDYTCGLASAKIFCWGLNNKGQFGDGQYLSSATPVRGGLGSPAVRSSWSLLAAGRSHMCAVTSRGVAYCWGVNTNGQIGDGTRTAKQYTPQPVSGGHLFLSGLY